LIHGDGDIIFLTLGISNGFARHIPWIVMKLAWRHFARADFLRVFVVAHFDS